MIITTTDVLQGVTISRYLGMVACWAPSGKISLAASSSARCREMISAINERLEEEARHLGANAVIGVSVVYEGALARAIGTAVEIA